MKENLFCRLTFILLLFIAAAFISCASRSDTIQAEEYYTIGMAFFELGRFSDAEFWLNRARAADKTMIASEYNLGRIAFETGRYEDAALYFERVLSQDPDNAMVLRAAAYARIKNGDLEIAEALYNKVLELIPENADEGFNYALVLYGLEKYEECEDVLNKYSYTFDENQSLILLFARAQKAQSKLEAVDSYAKWMIVNTGAANPQGIFEYGQALEDAGHFGRAIEHYKLAIEAISWNDTTGIKSKVLFAKASLLLVEDPENAEGLFEFTQSINEGFSDTEAIATLLEDERIIKNNRTEIQKILTDMLIEEHERLEAEGSKAADGQS